MNGKISRRVGMNWNFKGRRKRGGDDVDRNYGARFKPSALLPSTSIYQLTEARVNKSAQQSSTRVNNVVLYLTLLQSDTNSCLACITFYPSTEIHQDVQLNRLLWAEAGEADPCARTWWTTAAISPSSKMRQV